MIYKIFSSEEVRGRASRASLFVGTVAGIVGTFCGYGTNVPFGGYPMALTMKEIGGAKPDGKPFKLADGGGLCLLIAPSGAKLWRWRYRFDGKEKMMASGE
jgi:hypothetical protein